MKKIWTRARPAQGINRKIIPGSTGRTTVSLYFSPTLNFHNNKGLQYAVSIDDEAPQVFSLNKEDTSVRAWNGWVVNNCIIKKSIHTLLDPPETKKQ